MRCVFQMFWDEWSAWRSGPAAGLWAIAGRRVRIALQGLPSGKICKLTSSKQDLIFPALTLPRGSVNHSMQVGVSQNQRYPLGVPARRIIVFGGLQWVLPMLGNYRVICAVPAALCGLGAGRRWEVRSTSCSLLWVGSGSCSCARPAAQAVAAILCSISQARGEDSFGKCTALLWPWLQRS